MTAQVTIRNGGGSKRVVAGTVKDPRHVGTVPEPTTVVVEPGDTSNTIDIPDGMHLMVHEEEAPVAAEPKAEVALERHNTRHR